MRHRGQRSGYRAQVEALLGHTVARTVKIHHVNGDESDDTPKNLVVCQDQAYHALLHRRTRALRATGDPNAVLCGYCKVYILPGDPLGRIRQCRKYGTQSVWTNGYHFKCRADYERERESEEVMSARDDRQGEERKHALDAQALKRGESILIRQDSFYVRVGLSCVRFTTPTDPRYANLNDYAQCVICGAIVDVGGELTQHASMHL